MTRALLALLLWLLIGLAPACSPPPAREVEPSPQADLTIVGAVVILHDKVRRATKAP